MAHRVDQEAVVVVAGDGGAAAGAAGLSALAAVGGSQVVQIVAVQSGSVARSGCLARWSAQRCNGAHGADRTPATMKPSAARRAAWASTYGGGRWLRLRAAVRPPGTAGPARRARCGRVGTVMRSEHLAPRRQQQHRSRRSGQDVGDGLHLRRRAWAQCKDASRTGNREYGQPNRAFKRVRWWVGPA